MTELDKTKTLVPGDLYEGGIFSGTTMIVVDALDDESEPLGFGQEMEVANVIKSGFVYVTPEQAEKAVLNGNWFLDPGYEPREGLMVITSKRPTYAGQIETLDFQHAMVSMPETEYKEIMSALQFYADKGNDEGKLARKLLKKLEEK